MRIKEHPVLQFDYSKELHFSYNGKDFIGYHGDTIAAALHDNGIMHFSDSHLKKRPRGLYCAIGNCGSCTMTVNNIPHTKTCLTMLEEGMVVESEVKEVNKS